MSSEGSTALPRAVILLRVLAVLMICGCHSIKAVAEAEEQQSCSSSASTFSATTTCGDVTDSLLEQQQQQDYRRRIDEKQRMHEEHGGLFELEYDLGGQGIIERTWVYKDPENNTDETESMTKTAAINNPSTTADEVAITTLVRLCKFHNLSNRTLHLILKREQAQFELVKKYSPMSASAIACQLGQEFLFLDLTHPEKPVAEFVVPNYSDEGAFLFVYDAFIDNSQHLISSLPGHLRDSYRQFQKTLAFGQIYRNAAGRIFLSNFGRAPPMYPLWNAHHVGQLHHVRRTNGDDAMMETEEEQQTLTLEVLSTAPRLFKINNFLSTAEVQHIMGQAKIKGMQKSETLGQATRSLSSSSAKTRTSQTAWLSHHHSPTLERIYQRAAEVLQIPHNALLSMAEDLQVLKYQQDAEYKAHYDFGFPPIDHAQQPTRFATLLIYLNDDMVGGETAFPRARQQSTSSSNNTSHNSHDDAAVLKQKPETGTAVLFYSMLPDGNMDERSLHAALPVIRGEKYVCNMWVWDPVADLVGLQ